MIIKIKKSQFEPLQKWILEMHSYAVPKIVALPIIKGYQPYLDWMGQLVG